MTSASSGGAQRSFQIEPRQGAVTVTCRDRHTTANGSAAARRPIATLDGVHEIAITTLAAKKASAPAPITIPLTVDGQPVTISAAELRSVKETVVRNGKERGWAIADLVATQIAHNRVQAVIIEGSHGDTIRMEREELVSPDQVAMMKVNRSGALRFRRYAKTPGRNGQKAKRIDGIRNVETIRVIVR